MRVLIDTNVILDVLNGRKPHYEASAAFLKLCGSQTQLTGMIAASQTTDIYYLLRREGKGFAEAISIIQKLIGNIKVMDVTAADVKNALESEMSDYEDALLAFGGKRKKVTYIVTRNENDFVKSPVPVLSPQAFIEQFSLE